MNTSQQQLERIVAYLDGELSTEESAQVEQQLAADEQFRQELQGAERAWMALDELPMAAVGDNFSRTTMAMVIDAARHDVEAKTIALPVQRRKRKTTTALLATMVVLLGALVFRVLWNNPNRRLLADLPAIHNVDIYSQFHDVDFLRDLSDRLGDDLETSTAVAERFDAKLDEFQLVTAVDQRQAWLESLPSDEKVALRAKFNRFRDLSRQRQAEMRELHQQIESADDQASMLQTMFRYQHWLNELTPSEQYDVRGLPASDHARHVAQSMKLDAKQQKFELTSQQLQELMAAVRPYFLELRKEIISKMSRQEKKEAESWSDQRRIRESFRTLRESPQHMEELNRRVLDVLPEDISQEFQQLRLREKGPVVVGWLMQARAQAASGRRPGTNRHRGEVTEQELADFFVEELDSTEKERLLALPREKMQQRLEQLYFGQGPHSWEPMRPDWGNRRPPPHPGPPPEGRGRGRRDDRRGPGPPHGPRRGPEFDGDRERRPPRGFQRDRPPHRRPPEEPLPGGD